MKYREKTVKGAMDRVETFLNSNRGALGDLNDSVARVEFDAAMADFGAAAAKQNATETYYKSLTRLKHEIREDLRINHMRPIATIAQTAPTPPGDTSIQKLRVPRQRTNDRLLIASAMAMADIAAARPQMFLAYKLPETFIDELRATIAKLQEALDDRNTARSQHVAATKALELAVRRAGRKMYVLDSLVVKKLKGQRSLIATWKMAKRYTHKPGGPGKPDAAEDSTPTATAAAPES